MDFNILENAAMAALIKDTHAEQEFLHANISPEWKMPLDITSTNKENNSINFVFSHQLFLVWADKISDLAALKSITEYGDIRTALLEGEISAIKRAINKMRRAYHIKFLERAPRKPRVAKKPNARPIVLRGPSMEGVQKQKPNLGRKLKRVLTPKGIVPKAKMREIR
jgi:hypothetical protein